MAYFKTLVMQRHKNNLLHMHSKILCFLQFFFYFWVLQLSQEKLKTVLTTVFFGGGGEGGQIRCIVGDEFDDATA